MRQFGVSSSLLLPLHQVGKLDSWEDFQVRQFGVSSSLLLPLHQVGKLDSWEDFQDRQAMTLFTTGRQFGVSSSLLDNSVSVHHYCFPCIKLGDNSVSVHHYCFPCIKSVSWIHGKTSR